MVCGPSYDISNLCCEGSVVVVLMVVMVLMGSEVVMVLQRSVV